jgi:O-antigen/teichoic acid export membrane protein
LLVLVPLHGVIGAAIASALAHIVLVCFRFIQMKHVFKWTGFIAQSRLIVLCGAIAAVIFVFYQYKGSSVFALCSSLGTYAGMLLIVKETHVQHGMKRLGNIIKDRMGITG